MLRELLSRGGPQGVGDDPDYRFTLANERTFLAWIRTALALVAGGVGVLHLLPEQPGSEILGLVVLALAFVVAASSYRRWFRTEQAIRQGLPLPPSSLPRFVAGVVALLALVAAVLFIVGGA